MMVVVILKHIVLGVMLNHKTTYNQILDILKIANFQELKVIYAFLLSFLKIKS